MKRKRIWLDPGFWILVGVNGYLVYHYYRHPTIFTTLIWLYWWQSVLLGIFTVVDMLTTPNIIPLKNSEPNALEALTVRYPENPPPQTDKLSERMKSGKNLAFFFILHYGFFHLVYLVFIASMKSSGPVDRDFFKYFFIAFLAGQIITFVQHKVQQKKQPANLGAMFAIPYVRILPMHLTIILPALFKISNLGLFLILKAFADVVMYVVTKPSQKSKAMDAAAMASQQLNA